LLTTKTSGGKVLHRKLPMDTFNCQFRRLTSPCTFTTGTVPVQLHTANSLKEPTPQTFTPEALQTLRCTDKTELYA